MIAKIERGYMPKRKSKPKEEKRFSLVQLRESKGFSQVEFCAHAGLSISTLYRMENGVPVSRLTAGRAAAALGVPLSMIDGIQIIEEIAQAQAQAQERAQD